MNASAQYLNPSEAARRLGVSAKALRLYEERGLISPLRTAAGWRAYGPAQMARAAEIVALRTLGLGLAQTVRTLAGDLSDLEPALAAHQASLEAQGRDLSMLIERVREARARLAAGHAPSFSDLADLLQAGPAIAFDLPWPWGGERFELARLAPLSFIVGPLGSGKTRLAMRIAEAAGGIFLPQERGAEAGGPAIASDLAWLAEEGASDSPGLRALLAGLARAGQRVTVVDMVEDGLDEATQIALIALLRRRGPDAAPLFLMTRSSAILDLASVRPNETILYCPANHAPPMLVTPLPGAPGYEATLTCLATPPVRARTHGMIAVRPSAA